MGLVWGLGPWLALGLAAVLFALAVRPIHSLAKTIESKKVGQGFQEFLKLYRDALIHRSLVKGVFFITVGCLIFAGLLTAGIQGLVQRGLQEGVREMVDVQALPPPEASAAQNGGAVLDWILLAGLIFAGVTIVVGFKMYRSFRRRALEFASSQKDSKANRPIAVKLFHDNKTIGIILLVIGCWFFWGFLTQLAGLLLTFPALGAVTSKPIPGVLTAAIVFVVVLGVLMNIALFGPLAWFSWRNVKLQVRHLRENRIAMRLFHINTVFFAGCLGLILNAYLIDLLGRQFWPSIFH